jgi:hypothetical protein
MLAAYHIGPELVRLEAAAEAMSWGEMVSVLHVSHCCALSGASIEDSR